MPRPRWAAHRTLSRSANGHFMGRSESVEDAHAAAAALTSLQVRPAEVFAAGAVSGGGESISISLDSYAALAFKALPVLTPHQSSLAPLQGSASGSRLPLPNAVSAPVTRDCLQYVTRDCLQYVHHLCRVRRLSNQAIKVKVGNRVTE